MRVLIITPAFPVPDHRAYMGVQRNAQGVASGLHQLGADVKVVTTYWGRDDLPAKTTTEEGIPVIRLPDLSTKLGKFGRVADLDFVTFGRAVNGRTDLLDEADVVHSFMIVGATRTETPRVGTHHHWGSSLESVTDLLHVPFHTIFKNYSYANLDALTTPSTVAKEQLERELWIQPPPISVIPHGVDRKRFRPAGRSADTDLKSVRLLCVGPFEKRKRLQDFVEALRVLRERGVGFQAVFAGSGSEKSRLMRRIHELDMDEAVRFPGYLDDERLLDEYRLADMLIFPSELEGFGQVLVEAMATGTPPVVYDIPPMNEIVPADELIVPPRDSAALAESIIELIELGRINTLAETCRRHVEDNYDWRSIAEQYKQLYESLQ